MKKKNTLKAILLLTIFLGITDAFSQHTAVITGNTSPPLNQWITYTVSSPSYECEQILWAVWGVLDSTQASVNFPNDWDDCFEFYVYFESVGTYTISYDNSVDGVGSHLGTLEVTAGSNALESSDDSQTE